MKADLHIHTFHSGDNAQQIATVLTRANEEHLGAIAITDHNSLAGYKDVAALAPAGLIVVSGMEVSSAEGHILAYGISEGVPRDRSPAETIALIHEQGGIAVAAHPYRFWSGLSEEAILVNEFDAIEAFNARNKAKSNERAAALAQRKKARITAGSDSHEAITLGRGYAILPDDVSSAEGVIAAIMAGDVRFEGRSRPFLGSVRYVVRAVVQWLLRGMKRI
jgi:predicted metal-dependent phosphoesterase TrpH